MKYEITNIPPLKTAKFLALFSLIFTIPFTIIMAIKISVSPTFNEIPLAPTLFGPIIYGLLFFVSSFFGAIVYNFLVKWIGGIEYIAQIEEEKET
jgi:hypothetical protein